MRVTIKGQVTIPQHVREKMGITPRTEVDFTEEDGRFYLVKKAGASPKNSRFRKYRGVATICMTTDEIMQLTRG